MRLIDAGNVRDLFDAEFKETRKLILAGETHLDNLAEGFTEADRVIREMPIVDAEVVTRCKDCKHYANHPNGLCYLHTEPKANARGYSGEAVCVEPDDFCSFARRKDEANEAGEHL